MTAVFLLFNFNFSFFWHFYLFQGHSQTHKGRVHHTEASWDLEASQAVITSNYQSMIAFYLLILRVLHIQMLTRAFQ